MSNHDDFHRNLNTDWDDAYYHSHYSPYSSRGKSSSSQDDPDLPRQKGVCILSFLSMSLVVCKLFGGGDNIPPVLAIPIFGVIAIIALIIGLKS